MSEPAGRQYLDEKIASAPRDVALAIAFSPPERVASARTLQVLKLELEALLFGGREPDVIIARVGWWREEWSRLAQGTPRHPLTQALADGGAFEAGQLDPVLGRALAGLRDEGGTVAELVASVDAVGTALGSVEAGLHGRAPDPLSDMVWQDVLRFDLVLSFTQRLERGQLSLPLDLAASLQLSGRDIRRSEDAAHRAMTRLAELMRGEAEAPPRMGDAWVYRALRQLRVQRRLERRPEPGSLRALARAWGAARAVRRA